MLEIKDFTISISDRYLIFKPHIITFHLEACKDKEEVKLEDLMIT